MNKDQAKDASNDTAELPQIRFPIRGTKTAEELSAEQADIETLSKYVEETFKEISNATGLSEQEVLHVLEDDHVEFLKDVLKDHVDADVLRKAIQEAIKKISLATDLDTEQITHVFTRYKNTTLNDIVIRLRARSQASREKFGN